MVTELSVLIPTYNCRCADLVATLYRQLTAAGITFEIIVMDDCSPNRQIATENKEACYLPNATFHPLEHNVGRAVIRNLLAQSAHYERLLFIDGDMRVNNSRFITTYLQHDDCPVVDGGYTLSGQSARHNLRYRFELRTHRNQLPAIRQRNPYAHFHTSNFMVERTIMLRYPFDSRFRHYGYEDLFWGKTLREQHVAIRHIDNPVSFYTFETNAAFVAKTEEALQTLKTFQTELCNEVNLLRVYRRIAWGRPLLRGLYRCCGKMLRNVLTGNKPTIFLFNSYKLMYFSHL